MDLNTITNYRFARGRDDLALTPGERIVAGGSWMFSEPQLDATGLVDITTMGWPSFEYLEDGLRIAATATIAELARLTPRPEWSAQALFEQCANALLASFKVWNEASVGGNICCSYTAGAMISLAVALDATAIVWTADGDEYRIPVEAVITGNGTNTLRPGDVLRAVDVPGYALRARIGFRKIALATLGRSAAVLTGRVDQDGRSVFTITAATLRPVVLRYPTGPTATMLGRDARAADGYYDDPLGAADWRRAVSVVLLEEIRQELAA